MAYQNGIANDPTDLLQKLITWLVSIGWIQDKSASVGALGGWEAHLHLSTTYVHLRSAKREGIWPQNQYPTPSDPYGYGIGVYLSSGFNTGSAWNAQPGTPPYSNLTTTVIGSAMVLGSAAITNYHFFADASGDNVVVVVERTPGVYVYIGWGSSLQKSGAYSNGQYFFGSTSSYYMGAPSVYAGLINGGTSYPPASNGDTNNGQCLFVRVDVDSFTGKWIGFANITTAATGYTGKNGTNSVVAPVSQGGNLSDTANPALYAWNPSPNYQSFQTRATSSLDGRANLLPLLCWTSRDAGGASLLGSIPNVFYTNAIGNGFSSGSIYQLGTDNYMMFPNFSVRKQ